MIKKAIPTKPQKPEKKLSVISYQFLALKFLVLFGGWQHFAIYAVLPKQSHTREDGSDLKDMALEKRTREILTIYVPWIVRLSAGLFLLGTSVAVLLQYDKSA